MGTAAPRGRAGLQREIQLRRRMEMSNRQNLEQLLQNNSYPGRGIVIGKHADGQHAVIAYFIMGRSENSRNRVFV